MLAAITDGGCPIAKGIVCTTDKTVYKQKVEAWLKDAEATVAESDKLQTAKSEELKRAEEELHAFDLSFNRWQMKKQLLSQKEKMEANRPEVPTAPKMPTIEKTRTEAEIKADLDAVRSAKEAAQLFDEINKLTAQIDALDYLVRNTANKGAVQTAMMSRYMSVLSETCNAITRQVRPETSIELVAEDGVKVFFDNGEGLKPIQSLSTGETTYVSFIMMNMIHQLSGAKILLLDEASVMDAKSFGEILTLCNAFANEYEYIVVAGVDHDDTLAAAEAAGIKNLLAAE